MELLAARRRHALLAVGLALGGLFAAPTTAASAGDALTFAWRKDLGRALSGSLACDETSVVATTHDRRCGRYRLADGAELWDVRTAVAMQGGVVPAAGVWLGVTDPPDGRLIALAAEDGAVRWRHALGEVSVAPLVVGETCYAASVTGRVAAHGVSDGRLRWWRQLPIVVRAPLAASDSLLYVASAVDSLFALSVLDGGIRWSMAPGGALYGAPIERGGRLYVLTYGGSLLAVDAASGEIHGARMLDGFFRAPLAGGDPLIALSTAGRVTAIETPGLETRWERPLGQVGVQQPTVADSLVWIGLEDGSVTALALRDGAARCALRVAAPVTAPPAVASDHLLVAGGRGELVAYRWSRSAGGGAGTDARTRAVAPRATEPQSPSRLRFFAPQHAAATGRWRLPAAALGDERFRSLPAAGEEERRGGWYRWATTLGWAALSGLALWLQHEADSEYDRYLASGDPGRREAAFDRAERYDRYVVGAWVGAEVCFLLSLRAWLAPRGETWP